MNNLKSNSIIKSLKFKTMKNLKSTLLLAASVLLFSCSDDDTPELINEEELITTVSVTLTNGTDELTLTSKDFDGDGPEAPIVNVTGNLMANTTYTGTVSFLNELEDPAEDITVEVLEEGAEHQVFYQLTNSLGSVTYTDMDANGDPIGLNFVLATNDAGNGVMSVILKHEPNKAGDGVSTGDITNAGGETDVEVNFSVTVE